MKLVSTCIITRNEEEFLEPCLQSIWDISDEILIIDNNSTDKTLDIIYSFPQKKIILEKGIWNGKSPKERKRVISERRNRCLELAKGSWILVVDSDEIYKKNELVWLLDVAENTPGCMSIRYWSIQFWKDYDHIIVGPHWDDTQERFYRNVPGLNYNQFYFSVSEGKELLAKKYGKDFLNKIYWDKEKKIQIYHYGMVKSPEKIRKKIYGYMIMDNPAVNEENVEEFVSRHPYFSNNFDQPRHGPNGLWVAGSDTEKDREKVILFNGTHPETMLETVQRKRLV